MHRRQISRALTAMLTAAMMAVGLAFADPAAAQQRGGPFRILVAELQPRGGADADFAGDVREALRERIARLPSYHPVEEEQLERALEKYRLELAMLDCVKARQLALQMGVQLVICGSYRPARGDRVRVAARVISARSGTEYKVPAFRTADSGRAARRLISSFQRYTEQLRLTTRCLSSLESEQWQSALEECNQALAINATSVPALYGKARALLGQAKALAAEDTAAIAQPVTGTIMGTDTTVVEQDPTGKRAKLLEQALAVHKKVLELDPVHEDALLTAGIVATKLGRQQAARDYFNRYLELNPGNRQVRLKVAIDMSEAGDPVGALRFVERGMPEDSFDVVLAEYAGHFALNAAQEFEAKGDTARASELYGTALDYYRQVFEAKRDSTSAVLLRKMVLTLLKMERYEEAVRVGEQVVEAKPEQARLWSIYARALEETGQIEEAIAALDTVIALDPGYKTAYSRRAVWLASAGRIAEAREAIQVAIEQGTPSDKLARAIFVNAYNDAYKQGDYATALDLFALTREFATRPATRDMANFYTGLILYNRAKRIQQPQTAASAQEALPIFQNALDYFQQSESYDQVNVAQFIKAANQYIAIQEALIQRGR